MVLNCFDVGFLRESLCLIKLLIALGFCVFSLSALLSQQTAGGERERERAKDDFSCLLIMETGTKKIQIVAEILDHYYHYYCCYSCFITITSCSVCDKHNVLTHSLSLCLSLSALRERSSLSSTE